MNPIYSLIELRQSLHYYHHFSTLMVLLVYGHLVYFIAAALTITFLCLLFCKAISHTRIVALVLFPRWYKHLVCVELYQRLIELERTFILPFAPRWVRHSYLSKRLHTISYNCGLSPADAVPNVGTKSGGRGGNEWPRTTVGFIYWERVRWPPDLGKP
jgi:hypothetical protein